MAKAHKNHICRYVLYSRYNILVCLFFQVKKEIGVFIFFSDYCRTIRSEIDRALRRSLQGRTSNCECLPCP